MLCNILIIIDGKREVDMLRALDKVVNSERGRRTLLLKLS
jgi:hypothetical protein